MVAVEKSSSSLPANGGVPGLASPLSTILPRRILFHAAFRTVTSAPSSSSLLLTPLNAPPIDPPSSRDGDQAVRMQPELPQQRTHPLESLQSTHPPESLQSTPVQRIGAGLANLGNTCFLNSVLQCLTYTPPLASYLQSGLHKNSCRVAGFCAMCALDSHVKQALSISGRVVSPTYLVKNLRCISRSFQMWRQEDAHEYMRYLIEALQKCCHSLEASGGGSSSSQKSLIHKIFGGRLRSQVKCTQCSYCSDTYDPFLDLSLEIVRAESLLKALARFTAVEVLDGDNKYRCSRCKTEVRALKQFTIDKAPHILTVQFKRFSSSGGFGGKIDKKVQFDRTLDLKPFVNGGEDKEFKYSLYGVLVHSGWSTHSGHYYCFVRTGVDMWHVLDDSRVSQVSEKTVLEQKAYILFYIRGTKAQIVPDSNPHGTWEPKTPVVSDSDHHGGSNKNFSNGAHHEVNGSTKMNGLSSVNTVSKANGTLERNGSLKTFQNSNGHGFLDSLRYGSENISKMNGKSRLELAARLENKSVELVRSDHMRGYLENSQQQSSSAHTTSSVSENTHVSKGSNDGHLENTCRSGKDSDPVPVTERESKEIEVPSHNVAARSNFFEAADFAVPRWSEVEGCIGDVMEGQNLPGDTRAHCGYVLDEWDEEYDRGKRKKVRNKTVGKQTLLVGNLEGSDYHKKRKKVRHITAERTSPGNPEVPSHDNLFQAVAGSRLKVVNHRLTKFKTRRRALGYKLFLRRHLFKHF